MTSGKKRYYAGIGFTGEQSQSVHGRIVAVLVLLGLLAAVLFFTLRSSEPAWIQVTSEPAGLAVQLDMKTLSRTTPALLQVQAGDSLLLTVMASDMEITPPWYRVYLSAGDTMAIHFQGVPTLISVPAAPDSIETEPPTRSESEKAAESKSLAAVPDSLWMDKNKPYQAEPDKSLSLYLSSNIDSVRYHWRDTLIRVPGKSSEPLLRADGSWIVIYPEHPGYFFSPESARLQLDLLSDRYLYFHARPSMRNRLVQVGSSPESLEVLRDGQSLGYTPLRLTPDFLGVELHFRAPSGFITPPPRTLPEDGFILTLKPLQEYVIDCRQKEQVEIGYRMPDGSTFPLDEPVMRETDQSCSWRLGRQFPNRRPHGARYLQFDFELPESDPRETRVQLTLTGKADTKRYPLMWKRETGLDVWLNDYPLLVSEDITGRSLEKLISHLDVTRYVRPGQNRLRIAAARKSTTDLFLESIHIQMVSR